MITTFEPNFSNVCTVSELEVGNTAVIIEPINGNGNVNFIGALVIKSIDLNGTAHVVLLHSFTQKRSIGTVLVGNYLVRRVNVVIKEV